jgi:hypothetical protein
LSEALVFEKSLCLPMKHLYGNVGKLPIIFNSDISGKVFENDLF